MPRFEPFRALRYAADNLTDLVAPPYDVLSDADVDALQARAALNVTVVDVPRGGSDRYDRAAAALVTWVDDGVLVRDATPSFTLYRLRFVDAAGAARNVVGVLGGLEVVDLDAGGVLPHERTTPKAVTDRLDLTRATDANLSPVWGLSLATGLTELLAAPGEVLAEVVDAGVEHTVERVDEPVRVAAIAARVGSADVLIADGHHRYAISRTYRDEVRATGAPEPDGGGAELTLTFVNELVADQLSVEAIHRLYRGVAAADLRTALERFFVLTPTTTPTAATLGAMVAEDFLVLLVEDGAWRLTPRPGVFDEVRALDGAWLETALAELAAEVSYQHGLDETLAAVRSGDAVAAVLIRPVGIGEITRTATEGLLMPPKSTFFTPKLKTGFVIRPLGTRPTDG